MAVTLPDIPPPPPPQVQRFDAQGKPTQAQVVYETKLQTFLKAVKAAIEAM